MKNKFLAFIMAIVLIIVFGIFVYPGIYKYDKLNQNSPVKINRFTGETKMLTTNGWKDVTNNIATNSPSLPTFTSKSTFEPAKETPVTLGDISKVKIIGDTHDNSYLYKIVCTIKNEDILDNNIFVQATLYNDKNEPINILKSDIKYIEAGETVVMNLSTDDSDMTSKYKNYKLEIIQDAKLGYSYRRKKALGVN